MDFFYKYKMEVFYKISPICRMQGAILIVGEIFNITVVAEKGVWHVVRRHVPPSYIKGFPVPSSCSLVNSTPIELPPFMVVSMPLQ